MDLKRIGEIYDLLPTLIITLDPDPITRGPAHLADLIARCRNYLNQVGLLQHEVHREKHLVSSDLRALEAAFQVSFDEYLANDERVRRLPSIEDRKATVNLFLREERQSLEGLRRVLQDLELVDKAIRHRHKELSSTMGEIKVQRSLIQAEVSTGAMYGDERLRGVPIDDVGPAIDEAALDAALRSAGGDTEADPSVEAPTVESQVDSMEEVVDSMEEAVDSMEEAVVSVEKPPPGEGVAPVSRSEDDAIEAFLSGFSGGSLEPIEDI